METTTNQAIEALEWRYATKQYDATRKIANEDLQILKDSVRLAPTSYGLQPFKVYVVESADIREKLKVAGYGQPQITDASHLFVFAAKNNISTEDVDTYMQNVASTRGITMEDVKGFGDYIKHSIQPMDTERFSIWNARQTYIAMGMLLQTAAELKIDSTPMEGFDVAGFNEILGLPAQGLSASVICAVGYRSAEDATQHYAKVRKSEEDLFQLV